MQYQSVNARLRAVVLMTLAAWICLPVPAGAQQEEFPQKRQPSQSGVDVRSPNDAAVLAPAGVLRQSRIAELERRLDRSRLEAEILEARITWKKAEIQMIEAELRVLQLESRAGALDSEEGFLDQELSFESIKGEREMISIEDARRLAVPFPDMTIIDIPAEAEWLQLQEKRIRRP